MNEITGPKGFWARFIASRTSFWTVLLLAACLRIWHILSLRRLPLFEQLIIDSEMYDQWARSIAAGNWLGGENAFYMDPLYPYLLGALYWVFGHHLLEGGRGQV